MPYNLPQVQMPDMVGAFNKGKQQPLINKLNQLNVSKAEQSLEAGKRKMNLAEYQVDQKRRQEFGDDLNMASSWFKTLPDEQKPQALQAMTQTWSMEGKDDLIEEMGGIESIVGNLGYNNYSGRGASAKAVGGGDNVERKVGQDDQGNDLYQNVKVVTQQMPDGSVTKQEVVLDDTPWTKKQGNPMNTSKISRAEGEAFGKESGKGKGKASVKNIVADTEAFITAATEGAKLEVRQIADLKNTEISRKASVKKAGMFLDALKSGLRASGVGRQAASYAPIGTWTEQGEFDELLNAFSETAAREKLKASGELRPTDADVEGMKRAMFGIGRSEGANIALLEEFIDEQNALQDRLKESGQTPNQESSDNSDKTDKQKRLEELRAKQ